jgi:hypothetical protein
VKGPWGNHRMGSASISSLRARWAEGNTNTSSQADWPLAALSPVREDDPDIHKWKGNEECGFWHCQSGLLVTSHFQSHSNGPATLSSDVFGRGQNWGLERSPLPKVMQVESYSFS